MQSSDSPAEPFTVLLVEDNRAFGEALSRRLQNEGYTVEWVQDGFPSVQLTFENRYDVVIMDLVLPHMNGTAAARQIRWQRPYMPIIGVSATSDRSLVTEFLTAGGTTFIDKMNLMPQLFDTLRSYRDRGRHRDT